MKIKPNKEEELVKLFGSTSRARILTLLYNYDGKSFYQREVMFETGLSLQAVQRELSNLVDLGIIKKKVSQNRIFYRINEDSPLSKPLREVCELAQEQ
ncbi:MAG: winged helix-turn-helix transcriptional regulator [Deltaproteobacteria bacterium]|nr:winged helix-turn-helix transcriptional regulator [Deltaproteobacteria bacterium]